jgi:cell division protein FtsX
MVFPRSVAVFFLVAAFVPGLFRMITTWRARRSSWEIVANGLQGASLVPVFAMFLLPVGRLAQAALLVIGLALGLWSASTSFREYRRSKAAERKPDAGV